MTETANLIKKAEYKSVNNTIKTKVKNMNLFHISYIYCCLNEILIVIYEHIN